MHSQGRRDILARGLSGLLACLLAAAIAARPVAVCAGMLPAGATTAAAVTHPHGMHGDHQPASPHRHHDQDCCGICVAGCGGVSAAAATVVLPLPDVAAHLAPSTGAEQAPRASLRHLQPFALGPPAPVVA